MSGWSARPDVEPLGDAAAARGFTIATGAATGAWLFADDASAAVTDGAQRSLTGVVGGVETAGAATTYVLVGGSSLSEAGREVLSGDAHAGALETVVSGTTVDVSADGATHARVYAPSATSATWNGAAATMTRDPADAHYVLINAGASSSADAGASADASASAGAGADASAGGSADAGAGVGAGVGAGAAPDGNAASSSGCGCSTPGLRAPSFSWLIALPALIAIAFRRRRRALSARLTPTVARRPWRTSPSPGRRRPLARS